MTVFPAAPNGAAIGSRLQRLSFAEDDGDERQQLAKEYRRTRQHQSTRRHQSAATGGAGVDETELRLMEALFRSLDASGDGLVDAHECRSSIDRMVRALVGAHVEAGGDERRDTAGRSEVRDGQKAHERLDFGDFVRFWRREREGWLVRLEGGLVGLEGDTQGGADASRRVPSPAPRQARTRPKMSSEQVRALRKRLAQASSTPASLASAGARRDRNLSESAIDAAAIAFDEFDGNGSGRLDFGDFSALMAQLGAALGSSFSTEQIERMFELADADASGEIDFDEFLAVQRERRRSLRSSYLIAVQKHVHDATSPRRAQKAVGASSRAHAQVGRPHAQGGQTAATRAAPLAVSKRRVAEGSLERMPSYEHRILPKESSASRAAKPATREPPPPVATQSASPAPIIPRLPLKQQPSRRERGAAAAPSAASSTSNAAGRATATQQLRSGLLPGSSKRHDEGGRVERGVSAVSGVSGIDESYRKLITAKASDLGFNALRSSLGGEETHTDYSDRGDGSCGGDDGSSKADADEDSKKPQIGISATELDMLEVLFRKADVNGDGVVDYEEFKVRARMLKVPPPILEVPPPIPSHPPTRISMLPHSLCAGHHGAAWQADWQKVQLPPSQGHVQDGRPRQLGDDRLLRVSGRAAANGKEHGHRKGCRLHEPRPSRRNVAASTRPFCLDLCS